MKKLLLLVSIIFLFSGWVFSQTITITSPRSEEKVYKGDPYTITWTKSGTQHERVKIRLYNPTGTVKMQEITNNTENDGSFGPWFLPDYIESGYYIIRIKTINDLVHDDSDSFLVRVPSIKVSSPRGPDIFMVKDDLTIRWLTTGLRGDVRIEIQRLGDTVYTIRSSTPYNSSPLIYNIPEAFIPGVYIIKVIQSPYYDVSERFRISNQISPELIITKFTFSDIFHHEMGKGIDLEWRTIHLNQDIKIELLRHGRKVGTIVSRREAMANSYVWYGKRVEEPVKILAGKGYSIRICTINGVYCDETKKFELKNSSGLWVVNPQKNNTWNAGSYKTIKWNATNVDGRTIKIYLSFGGHHKHLISGSIPANQKEFRWKVGDILNRTLLLKPGLIEDCKIVLLRDDGGALLTSWSEKFKIHKSGQKKK